MKNYILPALLLIFISCSNDSSDKDYEEANDKEIQAYITDKNLQAQKSVTGLYYVIDEIGSGAKPTTSSNVTVAYKGYFTNGTIFDQSGEAGISFGLGQVISGWAEGLTYFNEGGSGKLLIPSKLGYGSKGQGSIPGGAVLIFDIELKSIN